MKDFPQIDLLKQHPRIGAVRGPFVLCANWGATFFRTYTAAQCVDCESSCRWYALSCIDWLVDWRSWVPGARLKGANITCNDWKLDLRVYSKSHEIFPECAEIPELSTACENPVCNELGTVHARKPCPSDLDDLLGPAAIKPPRGYAPVESLASPHGDSDIDRALVGLQAPGARGTPGLVIGFGHT
jgi:hypothetical protein